MRIPEIVGVVADMLTVRIHTFETNLSTACSCAAIERELRMTDGRDDFDFRSKWAVTADELMRHLNELQPTVIHFSGHGRDAGVKCSDRTRQTVGDGNHQAGELYLHDERGNPQCVTADALRKMIKTAAISARLVVLNACYSGKHASALRQVVDCVIGMTGAIGDGAARSFAVGVLPCARQPTVGRQRRRAGARDARGQAAP